MISKLKYLGFILLLFSLFSLASCSNEDDVVKRLTNKQKETYAQNISGEYPGQYVIIYKNKDCIEGKDEAGRPITVAHSEAFGDVQVDVSDNKMLHVFFQDFPVSLISKVVDADEGLSHALAGASPQASHHCTLWLRLRHGLFAHQMGFHPQCHAAELKLRRYRSPYPHRV